MANIPEALAAKRRDCVKRMLEKLARGESGSRWELSEWGERTHSDENFMLAVVKRLVERGLVKKPPYRPGGPAVAVPMVLSAALGATIDTSDETVIGLCWPSFAPQSLQEPEDETYYVDVGEDQSEYEPGEPQAPDKLDLVLRVVGQLAENIVYMREKLDGQKPTAAPDLDAVLDLLGSIEGKADVAPLRARLDQLSVRLGAIESKLAPADTSKLEDTIKVVNAVATGANEQGERVEAAMGKFDQRVSEVYQGISTLLKRPTAHVQVQPDPDTGQILKKVNALANAMTSVSNKQAAMDKGVAEVVLAVDGMTKTIEKSRDVWNESARNILEGMKSIGVLVVSQANASAKMEDALKKWAQGVDKALEFWAKGVGPTVAKLNGEEKR